MIKFSLRGLGGILFARQLCNSNGNYNLSFRLNLLPIFIQNNKTLVTLLDNLGNSFDSLRVPRNVSDHSDEQSISTENPPQKSEAIRESQPTSPHVSSEAPPNKADAEHDDETVEKKVYPVNSNLSV